MSYLAASLSKDAKRVVDVIEITADNYSVAWELLERRYENKYVLVKSYIEALFAVESIKKECAESLNRLTDDFERNLKMLQKVGENPENWSTILVFMMSSRLDPATLRHWETHRKSSNVPTYTELVEFLRSLRLVLQSIAGLKPRSLDSSRTLQRTNFQATKQATMHSAVTSKNTCIFCNKPTHSPYQCEHFRKLTPLQRFDEAKRNKLCINCLASSSHVANSCTGGSCRVCHQKHHTMLHRQTTTIITNKSSQPESSLSLAPTESQQMSSSIPPKQSSNVPSTQQFQPHVSLSPPVTAPSTSHCSSLIKQTYQSVPAAVLLSTALVKVFGTTSNFVWARALLDSGSELNFVSERLVQMLHLQRTKEFVPVSGIGASATSSKYSIHIRVQSQYNNFEDNWKFHLELPPDTVLADPSFYKPGHIDLILGVQVFYELLRDGRIKIGDAGPVLQNIALDWVISGRVKLENLHSAVANVAHVGQSASIEELNLNPAVSRAPNQLKKQSAKNTSIKRSPEIRRLGSSRDIADRRFYSLERRLNANPALKKAYSAFIHEYINLGHMKLIDDSTANPSEPSYYLPHHCIVRPDSTTTKLRVVFDASCATDSRIALNDALIVGPVIQDDLLCHILRFRMPKFVLTADIEKMYRQIRVCEADQPLQRIRWRDNPFEPVKSYQLMTVTYGTSSAPYLATKCLQRLSRDRTENFPLASIVVRRDFYMDDLLTGTNSAQEGQQLCQELLAITKSAGFVLRKWASNNLAIIRDVPVELKDERTLLKLDPSPIKTLGLQWETVTDEFKFEVPKHSDRLPITKRMVYSDIARLFDPLGLIRKFVFTGLRRTRHDGKRLWQIGAPKYNESLW
ncbi:uncharacterized protein LOC129717007 [Wyeomyia smithii]|uniref:uncharacterized protein LOC129717007 n=1 Tax=Wyeomyia smithii TaxID=174621 RepID=UPI0024681770|nr:uncharacterized protein LOC129717007 [Wyeomyia smithii]